MHKLERRITIVAVVVPFLAFIAAIALTWGGLVHYRELAIMAVMYLFTGFGVTIGFHRLFTHRSFVAPVPVRALFAVAGLDVAPGLADHLGGRPSQAPHVRRRGRATRTALTCTTKRASRASFAGLWHCAHRMAVRHAREGVQEPLRAGPARRPGPALHRQDLPDLGRARTADPVRSPASRSRAGRSPPG